MDLLTKAAQKHLTAESSEWTEAVLQLTEDFAASCSSAWDMSLSEVYNSRITEEVRERLFDLSFVNRLAAATDDDSLAFAIMEEAQSIVAASEIQMHQIRTDSRRWGYADSGETEESDIDEADLYEPENVPIRDLPFEWDVELIAIYEHLGMSVATIVSSPIIQLDVIDSELYKALVCHPELLRTLHWRTFEKLLAGVLESMGYEIELQRGTKDGGVDIFALKRVTDFGAQRFLVQAKRWADKVGVQPVRELAFLHSHLKMTKSCLATTATFTAGAWQLANQYRWQIELKDFSGLQDWIAIAAKSESKPRLSSGGIYLS